MVSYATPSYSGSFKETIEGGASVRIPTDADAQRLDSTYISRIFSTSSSIGSCFGTSPVQIDFVITPSSLNVFTQLYLSMTVVNNSGKAVTLLPTQLWFDYTELQISGQTVAQFYPRDMFMNWLALNPAEKIQVQQPYVAYGSYGTSFTPVTLGTGASAEYILPLDSLCFLTSGVLNDAMRSEIRLRFHQSVLANCIPSGQTGISLAMSNMQLFGGGISLAPDSLALARRNWAAATHVFPCVNSQVKTINLGSTTAGVLSGYEVLNAAQGLYSGVQVSVQDLSTYTPQAQLTPADLSQVSFYDIGQSAINFEQTAVELNYLQGQTFPLSEANKVGASTIGYYYVPFSTHFRSSLAQICNHGCRRLLGNESVRIATASSLTNAQATLYLYQLCQYVIDRNGSVTFVVRI